MNIIAFADLGRAAICMLAWRDRNEQNQAILKHGDVRRFSRTNHQLVQSRLRKRDEVSVWQTGSSDLIELVRKTIVPVFVLIDVADLFQRIKQAIDRSLRHSYRP